MRECFTDHTLAHPLNCRGPPVRLVFAARYWTDASYPLDHTGPQFIPDTPIHGHVRHEILMQGAQLEVGLYTPPSTMTHLE